MFPEGSVLDTADSAVADVQELGYLSSGLGRGQYVEHVLFIQSGCTLSLASSG